MADARKLILAAMDRHAVTWPDVQARVARDEDVTEAEAALLTLYAQHGKMPLVVAAAIITIIADKKEPA